MSDVVRVEIDGAVATIRLDRPPMNALNAAVQDDLRAAAGEVTDRSDVRSVIIYGGEEIFAAGADIKEMADLSYTDMVDRSSSLHAAFVALARIPKPVIAAVNGYALGGGCELTLTADLRIAGDTATFGQPEIQLGLIPGAGGTQRLSRLVGPSVAKDLVFTGRMVGAAEALAIGLVNRVVPATETYAEAVKLATRLARGPAYALRAAKETIDRGLETDLDTGLELERIQFAALFATEDRTTGMASFIADGPGRARFAGT